MPSIVTPSRLPLVAGVLMLVLTAVASYAGPEHGKQRPTKQETTLKEFLRTLEDGDPALYSSVFRDLDGDGVDEAIVYLNGAPTCGQTGCRTLVLKQDGRSWKIVARISATRLPIRVLESVANGWHDIGVHVQWEDALVHNFEADLSFDGKTYPRNPSAPPARRTDLDQLPPGQVVIAAPSGDAKAASQSAPSKSTL